MTPTRKRHSGEFKAKVALEALKGLKTVNEAEAKEIFGSRRLKEMRDQEVVQASLYEEIGRLKMELEWVKKTAGLG